MCAFLSKHRRVFLRRISRTSRRRRDCTAVTRQTFGEVNIRQGSESRDSIRSRISRSRHPSVAIAENDAQRGGETADVLCRRGSDGSVDIAAIRAAPVGSLRRSSHVSGIVDGTQAFVQAVTTDGLDRQPHGQLLYAGPAFVCFCERARRPGIRRIQPRPGSTRVPQTGRVLPCLSPNSAGACSGKLNIIRGVSGAPSAEFAATFARLREILRRHAVGLTVAAVLRRTIASRGPSTGA